MTNFGSLLREWRSARGMSQLALANSAEVSTRHVSYIETGKSAPSREMVLLLSSALDVPLRERNTLLLAAGFAPVYGARDLDGPEMAVVRRALEFLLERQEPFPALVVDRDWTLLRTNRGAMRLLGALPVDLAALGPQAQNAMHLLFHPEGLRRYCVNWSTIARSILHRLERDARADPSGRPRELFRALTSYPDVPSRGLDGAEPDVLLPVHLKRGDLELRLFTTITTLGTPLDVTAEELRIESYFAADDASERWFREGIH
jgi:transcriptional regulator with XRE-family HTH domain